MTVEPVSKYKVVKLANSLVVNFTGNLRLRLVSANVYNSQTLLQLNDISLCTYFVCVSSNRVKAMQTLKYDVLQPNMRASAGEYEVEEGFGWTNGVTPIFNNVLKSDSL